MKLTPFIAVATAILLAGFCGCASQQTEPRTTGINGNTRLAPDPSASAANTGPFNDGATSTEDQ